LESKQSTMLKMQKKKSNKCSFNDKKHIQYLHQYVNDLIIERDLLK